MTDDEITRRAAIEVMGWRAEVFANDTLVWIDDKRNEGISGDEWNPLADMNHAMMLVEAMRAMGYGAEIVTWPNEPALCAFWNLNKKIPTQAGRYQCKSISRAITMATLDAVEVENG